MDILVSGSLAYDRIMDFSGRFSDHIMPDKIHMLNVSFTVNGLTEKFGGTAGNIAYSLALLGEKPRVLATLGRDGDPYMRWLEQQGLTTKDIRIIPEELTASAYITTDAADNQITGFNPGAMKHPSNANLSDIDPTECIAIVSPGNLQDMAEYPRRYRALGVFFIFDPGQSLPAWEGDDLARSIEGSNMLVANDYEMELIKNKTGLSTDRLLEVANTVVVTRGEDGCEVLTPKCSVRVPAIPTDNVVDPTGAGDAFRGGLIKGLVQRLPVRRAAQMGTVCAHYAVQRHGTQEHRFSTEEFAAKLERHFGPWPPR
jgi:adenosine kinase